MELIWLYDKLISVEFLVSDRSAEPMDVMDLFETDTLTKVVYCGNPVGTDVSWFPPRSKVSTGVVAGVLATTFPIAALSIPWLAHKMVRVVLLPADGWQVQGEIKSKGHWQFNAVSDEKGVAAKSPQVALATNGNSVGSEMSHPFPPHPIAAPQLKGSE